MTKLPYYDVKDNGRAYVVTKDGEPIPFLTFFNEGCAYDVAIALNEDAFLEDKYHKMKKVYSEEL